MGGQAIHVVDVRSGKDLVVRRPTAPVHAQVEVTGLPTATATGLATSAASRSRRCSGADPRAQAFQAGALRLIVATALSAALGRASCSKCRTPVRGSDLLVSGRCPNGGKVSPRFSGPLRKQRRPTRAPRPSRALGGVLVRLVLATTEASSGETARVKGTDPRARQPVVVPPEDDVWRHPGPRWLAVRTGRAVALPRALTTVLSGRVLSEDAGAAVQAVAAHLQHAPHFAGGRGRGRDALVSFRRGRGRPGRSG